MGVLSSLPPPSSLTLLLLPPPPVPTALTAPQFSAPPRAGEVAEWPSLEELPQCLLITRQLHLLSSSLSSLLSPLSRLFRSDYVSLVSTPDLRTISLSRDPTPTLSSR